MFLTIFLGLILIGFFYILKVLTSTRGIVESFGIPYVKPFLIFGSPPFLFHKIIVSEYFLKQCKELGRTWGYYNGQTPTIVTIDPDFIKPQLSKFRFYIDEITQVFFCLLYTSNKGENS